VDNCRRPCCGASLKLRLGVTYSSDLRLAILNMEKYYKEGFLVQLILYAGLWLISDYLGLLLCMLMAGIIGGLWLFALLAEKVQKSKVPRTYFIWMFLSALAPALVAIAFTLLFGGQFDWLSQ